MAMKFLSLEEAAQQIGVSPDELNEMRQRQEIYGYRDGGSWKFKPEEVQRVVDQRSSGGSSDSIDLGDPLDFGDPLELDDDSMALDAPPQSTSSDEPSDVGEFSDDMVLLSEVELGESGAGSSATVIGKPGEAISPEESDVRLAAPDVDELASSSATIIGAPGAPQSAQESDIRVGTPEEPIKSDSSTVLGSPGEPQKPGESSVKLSTPTEKGPSGSATIIGRPGEPLGPAESDIKIVTASESTLPAGLGGSGVDLVDDDQQSAAPVPEDSGLTLSEDDLTLDSEPTLSFDDSSSDDYVLADEGAGSDITISPGDSGISLVDPADSGLALDAPLDLNPPGGAQALELSEDSGDVSELEFDSDEMSGVQASDDFLLTPLSEESDDSSESGSQVIAMEDSASFQASDDMFADDSGELGGMLEADAGEEGVGAIGAEGFEDSTAALGATSGAVAAREQPYPMWVVASLGTGFLFLALSGMMMYDLMRNMWSWNETYSINSTLMDTIGGWMGLK